MRQVHEIKDITKWKTESEHRFKVCNTILANQSQQYSKLLQYDQMDFISGR
jgi:hypothetical protein